LLAFVAAEAREFAGVLRHAERVEKLDWPLDFARKIWLNGRAVVLVANGPGPKLAARAAEVAKEREELTGLVSTGFCGALDPELRVGDIFIATCVLPSAPCVQSLASARGSVKTGKLLSIDRVASTAAEKAELRQTGADAVEMEAACVAQKAIEYNLPFYCVRVVTDTAHENLPLDFNLMRDSSGRFSTMKILAAGFRALPGLLKLNKRSKAAAQALGDFLAGTRF
jgi:adenosylhomocysteine nucleosidase